MKYGRAALTVIKGGGDGVGAEIMVPINGNGGNDGDCSTSEVFSFLFGG